MLIRLAADQDELKAVIDRAGPIAMMFVIALGIAIFVIWRAMKRSISRIDPELPLGVDEQRRIADAQFTERAVERGEQQSQAPDRLPGSTDDDGQRGEDAQPGR